MFNILICGYIRNIDGGCSIAQTIVAFKSFQDAETAATAVERCSGNSIEWHKVIRLYEA